MTPLPPAGAGSVPPPASPSGKGAPPGRPDGQVTGRQQPAPIDEGRLSIRFRIDGTLKPYLAPEQETELASAGRRIVSRVMVMAKLKIDQRRIPQSGRVSIGSGGNRQFDLRVETRPTVHGAEAVMRILPVNIPRLQTLIYDPRQLEVFRAAISEPHGLVLVTGPTGSGKSTTLYSALRELIGSGKKILTVEDPVEYHLDGISQTQVDANIGLDFPDVLRSALRSDPDIILVGEIRDEVTAKIVVQAAQTGHLVLSTLHTNSALESVQRLAQLGVADFNLSDVFRCVVSQHLAKRICRHCSTKVGEAEQMRAALGLDASMFPSLDLRRGVGCSHCNDTGHAGRIGVYEVVPSGETMKRYIYGFRQPGQFPREMAEAHLRQQGVMPSRDAALNLLLRHAISPEEFLRIAGTSEI